MSQSNHLITILMPVKNAASFLNECIESIISQTEENWELLAVDDGSSDSSYRILKNYADQDTRVHALKNSGSGIIEALRLAYANASGKLITRMDADDKMDSCKLETLKRNLMNYGKDHIAIGQVKYFSDSSLGDGYLKYESWLNDLTSIGSNYSDIYKECVVPSPCWMVFKEDLEKCDAFEPGVYPEDYDLCFRFYREQLTVIPSNQVLHFWRDHPERTSRNDSNYADNRFLELKLKWFLELDYNSKSKLVVWGAGKKGKMIAKLLQEKDVPFQWICNNPNKIGKHIYGVEMESIETLKANGQLIIAVANEAEQESIKDSLKHDAFWFC